MVDIAYEAVKLLHHSRETMQVADVWSDGRTAKMELRKQFPTSMTRQIEGEGFEFMGIKVEIDPDLPPNRIVLKAGRNTVGAISTTDA